MYSYHKLDIYGYQQEPVPHTFFRQSNGSSHVGIIFSGQNITCQHPTLYYPTRELLLREADTLLVDYALRPAFSTFSGEQIKACVEADTIAAYQALFRERTYQQVTLIGKSLGTLAMVYLLLTVPQIPQVRAIWLTPLLKRPEFRAAVQRVHPRSLFIIGTADPHYDAGELKELEKVTQGETLVIEGADHLLEVPGGIIPSLHVMEQIMQTIQNFCESMRKD
ncbi:MAG TPA: hypothetical protein VED37_03785 [Ktedonobacteraceae bacterium]|nr:hypothetical protein [Ktedonobacteraceae bacterium]